LSKAQVSWRSGLIWEILRSASMRQFRSENPLEPRDELWSNHSLKNWAQSPKDTQLSSRHWRQMMVQCERREGQEVHAPVGPGACPACPQVESHHELVTIWITGFKFSVDWLIRIVQLQDPRSPKWRTYFIWDRRKAVVVLPMLIYLASISKCAYLYDQGITSAHTGTRSWHRL
jgi:hypothetical protein